MQNPMQMMQQLKQFMNGFSGNPQEEAMKRIQQANLSQRELNELQSTANEVYAFAQKLGIIK